MKGMYTSAGNYSLRNSFPATDSGIAKKLREHGVVILGKLGLSEFANSFGNQPSGFSQPHRPGRSTASTPTRTRAARRRAPARRCAAALSMLDDRHRDVGLDHQPVETQGLVGLRPDRRPRARLRHRARSRASQDTAGPMDRTVADAALTLQSIAGPDPDSDAEYDGDLRARLPRRPASSRRRRDPVPNYMSALDLNFVQRQAASATTARSPPGSPLKIAYDALVAAGAIMVPRPHDDRRLACPRLPSGYEQHKTIDEYYKRLGPQAPIQSLVEEVADNQAEAQQALKFGNGNHLNASLADITPGRRQRDAVPDEPAAAQGGLAQGDRRHDEQRDARPIRATTSSRSSARVPSSPQAGYPQITIPMGYNATTRRTLNVSVNGDALRRAQPDRRRVRDRAGDAAAPAGQHGQPEHVPLRQDGAGAAVRRARRLQPGLRHDHEAARRHADDPAVLARDRVGQEPAGRA